MTSRDATREGIPQDLLRTVRKDIVRVAATTGATTFAYCPSRGQNECSLFCGEPQVIRSERNAAARTMLSLSQVDAHDEAEHLFENTVLCTGIVYFRIPASVAYFWIPAALMSTCFLSTENRPDRRTFFQSLECVKFFYQIPAPVTAVRPVALQRLSHDMIGQHGDPLSTADLVGTALMTSSLPH